VSRAEQRREVQWLEDIHEAIGKIHGHPAFKDGRLAFDHDEHYRVWVFYHIERIGECVSQLRKHFNYDDLHPDVDWKGIVGTRRHLVHWYWGVDNGMIWRSVSNDFGPLNDKIERLLHQKKQEAEQSPRRDDGSMEVRETQASPLRERLRSS
jgi:uncharacterized protein with HEPN domain